MKTNAQNVAALVGIIAVLAIAWRFIRSDSDKFEVMDTVPASFRGEYVKIFEKQPGDLWPYEETYGVEFLNLEAKRIGIRKWDDDKWEYFVIQKVHQLSSDAADANALIVFFGPPNDDHIAEHRKKFVPRSNQLLEVYDIFSPWGNDMYQQVGTYQFIEHYRGILKPLDHGQ